MAICTMSGSLLSKKSDADRDYIVKACNSHADMLTALEAVAECKSLFELNQAMPSVLAAIQKAKVA